MPDTLETVQRYLDAGIEALRLRGDTTIIGDRVIFHPFHIYNTEWEDGLLETRHKVEGFGVSYGDENGPTELDQRHPNAMSAAREVLLAIAANIVEHMLHTVGSQIAMEADREQQAKDVF